MNAPRQTTKALTLHQPHASLVALGAKPYETRSWSTHYRGPLAIHAGKSQSDLRLLHDPSWRMPFDHAGVDPHNLPLGAVVAVVWLDDVVPTPDVDDGLTLTDLFFGDFSPGRYAWRLVNVRRLEAPIPARGYQGLWTWTIPVDMRDWPLFTRELTDQTPQGRAIASQPED